MHLIWKHTLGLIVLFLLVLSLANLSTTLSKRSMFLHVNLVLRNFSPHKQTKRTRINWRLFKPSFFLLISFFLIMLFSSHLSLVDYEIKFMLDFRLIIQNVWNACWPSFIPNSMPYWHSFIPNLMPYWNILSNCVSWDTYLGLIFSKWIKKQTGLLHILNDSCHSSLHLGLVYQVWCAVTGLNLYLGL